MQEKKSNLAGSDDPAIKKTFLTRLEEEIKLGIFNVIYALLKDSDIGLMKFSILLFIEFLQMLQYAFSENFKTVWKSDSVFYYVSRFLSFTHIEPWMPLVNFSLYIVIFYLCMGILLITLLTFIYVSYSQQNMKQTFVWPIQALRQICLVTNTILFLPCLELFTSMLVCVEPSDSTSSTKVHYMYKDFNCWTGLHILHSSLAILASITYILISLVITLTFYKNLYSSTDASAKTDARADVQRLIQKIIVVYVFSFATTEKEQWFVIILYFILSVLTFERYIYLRSYHNEIIQTQHNVYRVICLWSNITILLSKILQHTTYNGGMQLFLLGIPLVVALTIFNKDARKDEMLQSITKFHKGEDVARQAKYYLQIIHRKETGDRNADIQLNGYIYLHEDSCPNSQCQLKQYKKNVVNAWISGNKNGTQTKSSSIQKHLKISQKQDNYQLLLAHAKNMYRLGIAKFPNSPSLRIAYAFFLIEKMNKKQEAIAELMNALKMHPTFDEQFIIFRHKKMSEEFFEEHTFVDGNSPAQDGQKNQQAAQNTVDLMARFAFESTFRQLQNQIENCANFHMEFWNQLKDERPDLGKLGDCGTRINNSIVIVENIWNELVKINSNVPKAMKLYGRYLTEILQDKEQGQEYLQRAKEVSNQRQNLLGGGMDSATDIQQMSFDGTPCIFVSGEPDKLGNITQCNSGAVRVFGLQAFEMKNQKVEKLMPELYGKNHQKILEEALTKGPENIPNKERLVFAKHKSGYIFPVWLQLKLIQSLQQDIAFIALFKIDKRITNSNVGFVLVNKEKKIQGISSSCIKMMNLDLNMMKRIFAAGYDIVKMAPEIEEHREELMQSKNGIVIEWTIPLMQKRKIKPGELMSKIKNNNLNKPNPQNNEEQTQTKIIKKKYKFLCSLNPIIMGNFGEIGSYVKLDVIRYEGGTNKVSSYRQAFQQKAKDTIRQPLFQFRFDYFSGKFIREMRDTTNQIQIGKNPEYFLTPNHDVTPSRKQSQKKLSNELTPIGEALTFSAAMDQDGQLSGQQEATPVPDFPTTQQDFFARKKRWGSGILIYALRDGKVQLKDQVDEEKKMMEMDEEKRKRQEEEERNMMEYTNFTSNIKSKQGLRAALNENSQSKAIRNLKITMNVVIMFLLALAISEYTVISGQFQEINQNFGMIEKSYLRISEIQRVNYNIRTLLLINEGRLKSYPDYIVQSQDLRDYLKADLELALNNLYDLQEGITLSQLSLSAAHQNLVDNKLVSLYFLEAKQDLKIINFTLTEAVLQLSSAIFTVRHMPLDKYTESQEDIFFVLYNSFNDFLTALESSSVYYEQELYTRSSEKNDLLLTLFVTSIVIIVLSVPILFPAVNSVNKSKDKVLALFIEIPNTFITELGARCEAFLSSFYSDDSQEDEVKSEDLISQKAGGGTDSAAPAKRNIAKQARNSSNTSKKFFIQFSVIVLLVIAYFTSMFVIADLYLQKIEVMAGELSIAANNEAHFHFLQNVQREMINNSGRKIKNDKSFAVGKQAITQVYESVQKYLEVHQKNREYHDEQYSSIYRTIMNGDLCKVKGVFQFDLIPQECSSLFNNAPSHGLQTVLVMYFDLLKEQLNTYQNLTISKPNQTVALLNQNTFKQLYWMQFRFLQSAFRALVSTLRSTTQAAFEATVDSKMALFVVFIISVVLGYMIYWSPFVARLSKDIWRTKMMLTIIPIHIIMKIPKIQEFLNKQASKNARGSNHSSHIAKQGLNKA